MRGRKSKAFSLAFKDGSVIRTVGGDQKTGPDVQEDLEERLAAWNDLVSPDGVRAFDSVDFTGGALVGGVTVDRFVVKPKDGKERVYFVHLDSGRVLRMDLWSELRADWDSLYFDDWRTAGGLQRPYKTTIWDRKRGKLLQTYEFKAIRKS